MMQRFQAARQPGPPLGMVPVVSSPMNLVPPMMRPAMNFPPQTAALLGSNMMRSPSPALGIPGAGTGTVHFGKNLHMRTRTTFFLHSSRFNCANSRNCSTGNGCYDSGASDASDDATEISVISPGWAATLGSRNPSSCACGVSLKYL
uniref:Uncharacterized protein n=1 Tax=Phlebotomus papatasi TaxID=29031 RepID=A0A1B0DAM3_PHLPP